jgi:hypothetical protein
MHQRMRVGVLRLLAAVALAGAMVAPNLVVPGTALAVSSPTITSFSPKGGPVTGGTTITVHGTGFVTGARLRFGGTYDATNVIVANSTTLTATTPAPAVFGGTCSPPGPTMNSGTAGSGAPGAAGRRWAAS